MHTSHVFDPELHDDGSPASRGRCSFHTTDDDQGDRCSGEAVVSFQDQNGRWQSGCSLALRQLVDRGEIEPLGQGG